MTNERLNLKYVTKKANAEWVEENPLLPIGVIAYESDTDKMKLFDGEHSFNELPYMTGNGGGEGVASGNLKSTVAFHQNSGVNKIEGNTLIVNGTFTDCQGEEFTLTNARIAIPNFATMENQEEYVCAVSKTGKAFFVPSRNLQISGDMLMVGGSKYIWFNPYQTPYKAIYGESSHGGEDITTDISSGYSLLFNKILNPHPQPEVYAFNPIKTEEDSETNPAIIVTGLDFNKEVQDFTNSWEWFNSQSNKIPEFLPEDTAKVRPTLYAFRGNPDMQTKVKVNKLRLKTVVGTTFSSIDIYIVDTKESKYPILHHTINNVEDGKGNWITLDFPAVNTSTIVVGLNYSSAPHPALIEFKYEEKGEITLDEVIIKTVYTESHNSELPNHSNSSDNRTVAMSGEEFQASANGWFAFSAKGLTSVDAFIIGKNYGFSFAPSANGITRFIIPCRKMDMLKINFEGSITEGKLDFFSTDM